MMTRNQMRMNEVFWLDEVDWAPVTVPLQSDTEADVLVIGAGYAGLSTAWHVLRNRPGTRVVMVDAGIAGSGASHRNAGMVEPTVAALVWMLDDTLPDGQAAPAFSTMVSRVHRAIGDVREAGIDCDLAATPAVFNSPFRPARELLMYMRDRLVGLDIAAEWVDADAARERWGGRGHGALRTDGYVLQPAKLALGLRTEVLAAGAELHERTPVHVVEPTSSGGHVAVTANGHRITCRQLVDATSVWSASLGLQPRHRRDVQQTSMFATTPVPAELMALAGSEPAANVGELTREVIYRRAYRDRLLFGAYDETVDEPDPPLSAAAAERLLALARKTMPWLADVAVDAVWGGPVKATMTDLPRVGALTDRPGIVTVAGNGSAGIPWCLVGGAIAAGLLLEPDERDPELELLHHALRHTRIPWLSLAGLGISWLWRSVTYR